MIGRLLATTAIFFLYGAFSANAGTEETLLIDNFEEGDFEVIDTDPSGFLASLVQFSLSPSNVVCGARTIGAQMNDVPGAETKAKLTTTAGDDSVIYTAVPGFQLASTVYGPIVFGCNTPINMSQGGELDRLVVEITEAQAVGSLLVIGMTSEFPSVRSSAHIPINQTGKVVIPYTDLIAIGHPRFDLTSLLRLGVQIWFSEGGTVSISNIESISGPRLNVIIHPDHLKLDHPPFFLQAKIFFDEEPTGPFKITAVNGKRIEPIEEVQSGVPGEVGRGWVNARFEARKLAEAILGVNPFATEVVLTIRATAGMHSELIGGVRLQVR